MVVPGIAGSVVGKRRRNGPKTSLEYIDLLASDLESRSSPKAIKGARKTSSTLGTSAKSSSPTKNEKSISERAKRAQQRASCDNTPVLSSRAGCSAGPDGSKTQKQTHKEQVVPKELEQLPPRAPHRKTTNPALQISLVSLSSSSSSENDSPCRSSRTRRPANREKIMENLIKKAKQEYKEAAAAYSPMEQSQFPSTMQDNLFVRQLSFSQAQPPPLTSKTRSNRRYPLSTSIESEPESPVVVVHVPRKISTASREPHAKALDDVDPIADFARRLSDVAQTLANRSYESPDSLDDSGTIKEILRSDLGRVASTATVDQFMASNFAEMMQQISQNQVIEITRVAKEHISIESQRLATLIKTQPPSAPPPAQPWQDLKFLYRVAEEAALYGAQIAILDYQKHFCDGRVPIIEQDRQLLQENAGHVINPRRSWLVMEPRNDPRFFCSTTSRYPPNWRRTLRVPMNENEMYACLTTDAARYRFEFMTSAVQMLFGGNVERQNQSRYPLVEMGRERQAGLQKQEGYHQPQLVYVKDAGPGLNQPTVEEQWSREQQPSSMMEFQDRVEGAPKEPMNNTWKQGAGIHFAPSNQAPPFHTSPSNSKICAHFARGHCKFGACCKKSHDLTTDFTQRENFSDVNHFQDRAQQPKRKKKPINQKMQLVLAPGFIPEGSYSEVNYFHNDSPRPYQGNDIFNNVVSKHGRGDGKKGQKARAVDYSGGNGNDMYYEHLGRNDAFENVNNRGRRKDNNNFIPDIPMNKGLHMGNFGNFNGQMRHDRSGNIGQGSIITQPEPHHGGRRRGRRN